MTRFVLTSFLCCHSFKHHIKLFHNQPKKVATLLCFSFPNAPFYIFSFLPFRYVVSLSPLFVSLPSTGFSFIILFGRFGIFFIHPSPFMVLPPSSCSATRSCKPRNFRAPLICSIYPHPLNLEFPRFFFPQMRQSLVFILSRFPSLVVMLTSTGFLLLLLFFSCFGIFLVINNILEFFHRRVVFFPPIGKR